MRANSSLVSATSTTSPVDRTALTRTSGSTDKRSFASRAFIINSRESWADSGSRCDCSITQQNSR